MTEPRGSGASSAAHNDVHDFAALAESIVEVSHVAAAYDQHSGVCEWTVSGVVSFTDSKNYKKLYTTSLIREHLGSVV